MNPRPELLYNLLVPVLRNLRVTLEMIKWEHSIFALPFALCGAMLAASGLPTAHQLLWIVVAMVSARSAAMAFNRLADAAIDAANPRTRTRALPAGHLSSAFVATFVIVSCAIFILAAVPTESPHALAFAGRPRRSAALLLHQALHALVASRARIRSRHRARRRLDRGSRLPRSPHPACSPPPSPSGSPDSTSSTPVRISNSTATPDSTPSRATSASPAPSGSPALFHLIMLLLLIALLPAFALGKLALAGVLAVTLLLLYEHSLVKPDDLSNLNAAFFTMNGVISVVFAAFVAADILLRK